MGFDGATGRNEKVAGGAMAANLGHEGRHVAFREGV